MTREGCVVAASIDVRADVERVHRERYGADCETRQKISEQETEERAEHAEKCAFGKECGEDLPACRAHRAQRSDFGAPLHHGDGHGVVDQECADEERDQGDRGEVHLKAAQQAAHFIRTGRWFDDARAGRDDLFECGFGLLETLRDDDAVNAIDRADFSEELLCGADVDEDDARVGRAYGSRNDSRDGKRDGPPAGERGEVLPDAQAQVVDDALGDDRAAAVHDAVGIRVAAHVDAFGQRLQQIHSKHAQNFSGVRVALARAHDD
jgi:hypothetical protein